MLMKTARPPLDEPPSLPCKGRQSLFRGGGVLSDEQIQVAVLIQVDESAAQADGSELVQPGWRRSRLQKPPLPSCETTTSRPAPVMNTSGNSLLSKSPTQQPNWPEGRPSPLRR